MAISNIYNFDIFGYSDRAAARGILPTGHVGSGIIESEGADTLGAVTTISNIDFGAFPLRTALSTTAATASPASSTRSPSSSALTSA